MAKKPPICEKCDEPKKYDRKRKVWYCPTCLLSAFLTDQAQRDSMKRYRQSEKGTEASQRYEQSEKGKVARQKYLKGEKYKQRRKEYNDRLKESLRIAREALGVHRGARPTQIEQERDLSIIRKDVLEFTQMAGHTPTLEDVKDWAHEYDITLSDAEAQKLIQEAVQ